MGLGIRSKCQSAILIFVLTRKPLLFARHFRGVGAEKSESVKSRREYVIIRFSWLRFVDDLSRLLETLQCQEMAREVLLQGHFIRRNMYALLCDVRSFFILTESGEYNAQIVKRGDFPWVVRDRLLVNLGCVVKFPIDRLIVAGCNLQPFPFAGMFP